MAPGREAQEAAGEPGGAISHPPDRATGQLQGERESRQRDGDAQPYVCRTGGEYCESGE